MPAPKLLGVLLLAALVLTIPALAQTVFHPAEQVAPGIFGADFGGGNFTFNSSLNITDKLDVSGTISGNGTGLTDLNASRLATGTVSPGALSGSYDINITGNASYASTAGSASSATSAGYATTAGYLTGGGAQLIFQGSTATVSGGTLLVSKSGTNDPVASFGGTGGNSISVIGGAGSNTLSAFVAGSATQFLSETAAGDMGFRYIQKLFFGTGGASKVVFDSSGNVGIGTTSPSVKLDVNGHVAVSGTVYTNSLSSIASNNPLQLQIGGTTKLFINDTTGNVGIGTTSPKGKLDVAGGISVGGYAGVNTPPVNGMIISSLVGIGTTSPQSIFQIGTSLDSTLHFFQIDTMPADTAGPPPGTECNAAAKVGKAIVSTRYDATAEYRLWVCTQNGTTSYAWKYATLT